MVAAHTGMEPLVRHPSHGEIRKDFARPDKQVVARLAKLPTANVSDAMAKAGVMHHAVKPLWPGLRACGPAFTSSAIDLTVKKFALSLVQPGDVFVLAARGVSEYACMGELSSHILRWRGAAGAIVDGAVRDAAGIREAGVPVFARAVTPHNYHYPFGLEHGSVNLPVVCGGVEIHPGDVVCADDDGVVVVPRAIADDVATAAEAIFGRETYIRSAIDAGKAPLAALEDELRTAGYKIT
jgi:4-hydroxy-4-methyl-2-oxoglutarate aldolase